MRKIVMSLILLVLVYLIYDAVALGTEILMFKPATYEKLMEE